MFTIVVLVLFTTIKSIPCIKFNETIADGVASLPIWPMRLKPKDVVVSTLPLRFALNKLAVAADSEAKEELLTSLGVTDEKTLNKLHPALESKLQCLRDSDLIMLNKLYVNHSDAVAPSFFADSFKIFGVQVEKTHFAHPNAVVSIVNQWVDVSTYKRVTDLLKEDDIKPNFNMILVNALHMKLTWSSPFDVRFSIMKPFTLHNEKDKVQMRMMTTIYKYFFYYQDRYNGFEVVRLNLHCPGCKITFFLPRDVPGLPKLLKLFAERPAIIKHAMTKLKEEMMTVRLPVMKIKTLINWTPYLESIGIKKIFNSNSSGLDAISQDNPKTNHYLGNVIQKVFLEIDEFGIRREAPRTPIDMKFMMNTQHVAPQFIADHPFYFRVDIEDSGVLHELLSGVFYGTE